VEAWVGAATWVRLVPSNSKNSVGGAHWQALSTGPGASSTLPSGKSAAAASAITNCSIVPAGGQLPDGSAIVGKLGPLVQIPVLLL
jgi:hypothetical protein